LTDKCDLTVAVPWSLSHYIPLNGFHPIYRALIDERPESIKIFAWDNVALWQHLKTRPDWPNEVMARSLESAHFLSQQLNSRLAKPYIANYWPPNIALTDMLPGDIEFHHTAPFPSLTRPFIFYCESFTPVFFPFVAHQGTSKFYIPHTLRNLYHNIFKNPLCLGIYSHMPETLRDFSRFFKDDQIYSKLYQSRIGLSVNTLPPGPLAPKSPLTEPRFLFVNSADQQVKSFFLRGGHIALRFWQAFCQSGNTGRLYMYCRKPTAYDLTDYGVDTEFIQTEDQKSIIWIEGCLENHELNALLADAHFFLLPGHLLRSVSIMRAMALGSVPVVTDTVGTSLYVQHNENGIVLKGIFDEFWTTDPETGILVDQYHRNPKFETDLVNQLFRLIDGLLDAPYRYEYLRGNALATVRRKFSGSAFSDHFWNMTRSEYFKRMPGKNELKNSIIELNECTIKDTAFKRIFERSTQPLLKINCGTGCVTELGGSFIHHSNKDMGVHEWSVMAEYALPQVAQLRFSRTIKGLDGGFLVKSSETIPNYRQNKILKFVSKLLRPFPKIHRFASETLDNGLIYLSTLLKKKGRLANVIDRHQMITEFHDFKIQNGENPELILEDVHGFNIICYSEMFYAIPQTDGPFDFGRILSNDYSCVFFGKSVDYLLQTIKENVN
jgi:glycosyltransferase involved in cell wall biosynthesis